MSLPFFDTNVLIYAFADDARAARARELVERGGRISIQSLNEFARVVVGKLRWSWDDARAALAEIEELCGSPGVIDLPVHRAGLDLAERYGLQIFDATLLASAIDLGSPIFYSEDMHDGLVVAGRITVVNPFA